MNLDNVKFNDQLKQNVLDYDDVLEQVKDEINTSRDFVRTKRETFRTRLKLYNNQRKQADKIGDTSLYDVINVMLAIYYIDEMQVSFRGRNVSAISQASNMQNVAKFDYDEMELETIDYLNQWDRLFFGVGIKTINDWDKKRVCPVAKSHDALTWLPDPAGHLGPKHFRWHGFENEYLKSEMTEEAGFINLHLLEGLKGSKSSESEKTRIALREAQNLVTGEYQQLKNTKTDKAYDMVDIYTNIIGSDGVSRKYLVTVDDGCNDIYRCEELPAVTIEEEQNPSLIPFPLSLHYFSPERSDPFGVSVGDLVEDKQRAKSVIKNLRLAMRKAQLYPMYLYNKDKIRNKRDLDFAFNKFIAVHGDVTDGVVRPMNKAPNDQNGAMNDEQSLDRDIEKSTGADRIVQGVMAAQNRTLGENEMVQANANLRFLLGSRINSWGEKQFWKLWIRSYRANMSASDKKITRINGSFGYNFSTFLLKDFITSEDPDIVITSKLENDQKIFNDRNAFAAIYPQIIADPTKPLVSKRFAERKMLTLYGLPQDEIMIISPETSDEQIAKMENELLSRNEKVDINDIDDHLSHILINSQAEKTIALIAHLSAHRAAYVASGQMAAVKANEAKYSEMISPFVSKNSKTILNNNNQGNIPSAPVSPVG